MGTELDLDSIRGNLEYAGEAIQHFALQNPSAVQAHRIATQLLAEVARLTQERDAARAEVFVLQNSDSLEVVTVIAERDAIAAELAATEARLGRALTVICRHVSWVGLAEDAYYVAHIDLRQRSDEEGWYEAECDECGWQTDGSEPVAEQAAREHVAESHLIAAVDSYREGGETS